MTLFRPAQRHKKKLRCAIEGTSGSGKTMSALLLAEGLVGGNMTRVAVIDTEHESADLYATLYAPGNAYQVLPFSAPFSPARYMKAMQAAADEGFEVVIIDSLSHAWMGPGGVLEIVDQGAKRSNNPNKFAAWNEGTKVQNQFIEFMLALPLHVIATMRSKTVWGEEEDKNGKKKPVKIGVGAQQRKEMDFEFDLVLQLDADNVAAATKHRTQELWAGRYEVITRQHGEQLLAWLNEGSAEPPKPAPQTIRDEQAETPHAAPTHGQSGNGSITRTQAERLHGMLAAKGRTSAWFLSTLQSKKGIGDGAHLTSIPAAEFDGLLTIIGQFKDPAPIAAVAAQEPESEAPGPEAPTDASEPETAPEAPAASDLDPESQAFLDETAGNGKKDPAAEAAPTRKPTVTAAQLTRLGAIAGDLEAAGVGEAEWRQYLFTEESVRSRKLLTKTAATRMIDKLAKWAFDLQTVGEKAAS